MSKSAQQRKSLEELAADFLERHQRGEAPSVEAYVRIAPHLAADIRELFPTIAAVEHCKQESTPVPAWETWRGERPQALGEYRLIREVGRGGMGIVYEAVQTSIGRRVALKVLPQHLLRAPENIARFRREARTAARLSHPNIVNVFGLGEAEGSAFIAMQFVDGVGLDRVIDQLAGANEFRGADEGALKAREAAALLVDGALTGRDVARVWERRQPVPQPVPQPPGNRVSSEVATRVQVDRQDRETVAARDYLLAPSEAQPDRASGEFVNGSAPVFRSSHLGPDYFRSVALLGMQVADALAYAHSGGVLHRDIKPSNLLLDARGSISVADFGLAKAPKQDTLSSPGKLAGTLRYMAPERFLGDYGQPSDVYSLGITLYEMLTLQPAFAEQNEGRLVRKIVHERPAAPRSIQPNLPEDLEAVIVRAISPDPALRFTAEELQSRLEKFLMQSEPRTWTAKISAWMRRRLARPRK